MQDLPVVILCGGMGTRLREQTQSLPKALVPIGGMPILLHVMKIYEHYGYKRFVFCLGYMGESIKQYFLNYELMSSDFKLKIGAGTQITRPANPNLSDWEITFVDTGLTTQTGGRIKKVEKYIDTDDFLATYCDGVADIKLRKLIRFHKRMKKVATLTAVHPMSPFGIVEMENDVAVSFKEKPVLPGLTNGGFFVFDKRMFDYLDESSVLEEEPLRRLASERELAVYYHEGFWACMDTYKDFERLNILWDRHVMPHTGFKGSPPWKVWK